MSERDIFLEATSVWGNTAHIYIEREPPLQLSSPSLSSSFQTYEEHNGENEGVIRVLGGGG